jgi:acetyl-CoA carboxylase carboxyltransferase component
MCGKAYDPRFIFAWPTAQIAVMGGKQASETLLSIKLQQIGSNSGKEISTEEQETMLKEISTRYDNELDPLFAAARLWVDAIIDPIDTRMMISRCLEIASCNPHLPEFNPGVIQM